MGEKTRPIIDLFKLIKLEMHVNKIPKAKEKDHVDYVAVYRLFVRHRKLKLLRYLFSLNQDFGFSVELFQIAIEEDAYDVACLLHREFGPMLRELIDCADIPVPEPVEAYRNLEYDERRARLIDHFYKWLCASLVQSFNRTSPQGSGMLHEKCYLCREFLEHFNLKHAQNLLVTLDKRITAANKFNLFIGSFNVALSCCLLIELLELISAAFD